MSPSPNRPFRLPPLSGATGGPLYEQIMDALTIPSGMGAIVRTAGVGRAVEELQWDLDNLKVQWDEIVKAVLERPAPFLVYRESDPVTRALSFRVAAAGAIQKSWHPPFWSRRGTLRTT